MLTATNGVTATTTGNALGATSGAGIAIAVIVQTTEAYIDSTGTVVAQGASLNAAATSNLNTTATASPGGAQANGQTPNQRTNNNAKRQRRRSVDVAGALAFNFLTTGAKAYIDPNGAGTATVDVGTGALTLDASSTDVVGATADGEKVGDGSELGVAVAVNVILPTHEVYLGNQVTLTAGSVTLQATSPNPDTYTVSAKSGAGGDGAGPGRRWFTGRKCACRAPLGRHSPGARPLWSVPARTSV